ncbi:hypothetical protein CK223_29015 [Mesorhizobium loti]|nr:hypothetical protein CK223_29015 [Mesorhizobium loti]
MPIRVFTKTGADWTRKYTGLIEAARELEVENAIIDGKASGTRRSTAQRVEETAGEAVGQRR